MKVLTATTQQQIADCYPVMSQLRPHLNADEFQEQVNQQSSNGYQLVYLTDNETITAWPGESFYILKTW